MPELVWDGAGSKYYEAGASQGVLYKKKVTIVEEETVTDPYGTATAWNGLISVSESPEGGDPNDMYADDVKYASIRAAEKFNASVECYTYPVEFNSCLGEYEYAPGAYVAQQVREPFGFSFKTLIGNDEDGLDKGYKLHLIYGCTASPSEKSYETLNDSPDAMTFSFDFDTIPVKVAGYKPTSHITIDSTKADEDALAALEAVLYGTSTTDARLPLPDEVKSILDGDEPDEPDEP